MAEAVSALASARSRRPGKLGYASRAPPTELGLKDGQAITSLTLQEYGGVVYWDATALSGEVNPATDPLASFRVWWKSLDGKAQPDLPAELHADRGRRTIEAVPAL